MVSMRLLYQQSGSTHAKRRYALPCSSSASLQASTRAFNVALNHIFGAQATALDRLAHQGQPLLPLGMKGSLRVSISRTSANWYEHSTLERV